MTAAQDTVDILRARRVLGRKLWGSPESYHGIGWTLRRLDGTGSVVISTAPLDDDANITPGDIGGTWWLHASISRKDQMPTYDELRLLHDAVFGDRWSYQCFAPPSHHVNIHEHALHLWGRVDGKPALPNFGRWGTI